MIEKNWHAYPSWEQRLNQKQAFEYFFWDVKVGLISRCQKKIPDFSISGKSNNTWKTWIIPLQNPWKWKMTCSSVIIIKNWSTTNSLDILLSPQTVKVGLVSGCHKKNLPGFLTSRKVKWDMENMNNCNWKLLKIKIDITFYHSNQ